MAAKYTKKGSRVAESASAMPHTLKTGRDLIG
jgi:hypothetical protein